MSSLRDRMAIAVEWVDAHHGRGGKAEWQRLADVSRGYLARLRGSLEENPEAGHRDSVSKLSRALSELSGGAFGPVWLQSGVGPSPTSDQPTREPPTTEGTKAVVLAIAREMAEFSKPALAGLGATPEPSPDPGIDHWWEVLRAYEARVRDERARLASGESAVPANLARAIADHPWHPTTVAHALTAASTEKDRTVGRWISWMEAYESKHRDEVRATEEADAEREPPERSGDVVKGGRRMKRDAR